MITLDEEVRFGNWLAGATLILDRRSMKYGRDHGIWERFFISVLDIPRWSQAFWIFQVRRQPGTNSLEEFV
jgi:hypothetical protein